MRRMIALFLVSALLVMAGCGDQAGKESGEREGKTQELSGSIAIDGSSTVFPLTEAVAEEFQRENPGVRVMVAISGTGGGFKKFTVGETDINDASRPIKSSEMEKAGLHGIECIELPIAYDGIAVMVNPSNDFVDHLTVGELKKIWQPGSTVRNWSDVRAGWPEAPVDLYGPGTDSGTFDYFTKVINGKEQASRPDFTASEDDNVLVQGIAGDKNSLGYFGFAYYIENTSRLRIVPVDGGDGPVTPSVETINNGDYKPLSRPIFIYVNVAAAARPEVKEFVRFYLKHARKLVADVGYVALPDRVYGLAFERFDRGITGSVLSGVNTTGITLEKAYAIAG